MSEEKIKSVLMERDGIEEDEAEARVEDFREEMKELVERYGRVNEEVENMRNAVITVLEDLKQLAEDHFGLESDYVEDMFFEELDEE